MSVTGIKYMWVFVFFDLPVKTRIQRKRATQFRNFLLKDGYCMIQFSVYARICQGPEGTEKHTERIRLELPLEGSIRVMHVTEKQYSRMLVLLGKKNSTEKQNESKQLCFF